MKKTATKAARFEVRAYYTRDAAGRQLKEIDWTTAWRESAATVAAARALVRKYRDLGFDESAIEVTFRSAGGTKCEADIMAEEWDHR